MTAWRKGALLVSGLIAVALTADRARLDAQAGAAPVIVVETARGTLTLATFPNEAPATVAHVVGLVRRGFYDGLRVHRALPGFIVQFGDPQTRDSSKRERWGRGTAASSGTPIGVAEVSPKRPNRAGAVGVAHMGDPAKADSQIYITLASRPDLDGQYGVFAQVVEGSEVPALLQVGDEIRRVYVRE